MLKRPGFLLFLILAFSYLYVYGTRGANANAHYDVAVAIVADGTPRIDPYVNNTPDWSFYEGHFYACKAPGLSLLAVPPYFILYHAERLFGRDPLDQDGHLWWANLTVLNALLNAIPTALAALALVALLTRWGLDPRLAHLAAIGWGLATLTFPFATTFFSHVPTAACLLLALALVESPARWKLPLAGLLCGLATLCEYVAVIPSLGLAAYVFFEKRSWRDLLRFCAGAAPMAVILFAYQWVCFGSPFTTAYAYVSPEFAEGRGLAAQIEAPTLGRVWHLLVSPYRGLFFYTPLLLLWFPGLFMLWRGGRRRPALLSGLIPPAVLAVVASWNHWEGGASAGPRHLISILPFMMAAVAFALPRLRWAAVFLGVVSLANAFVIAVVQLAVPEHIASPLTQQVYPGFFAGGFGHDNVGLRLGLRGHVSLIPLVALWALLGYALFRSLRGAPSGEPVKPIL